MTTVPTEAHNRLPNLHTLTAAQPYIGSPYFLNPTLRNFEPRLGFAWSPNSSNKTLLRGGFGVFDVLPLPYQFTSAYPHVAPFYKLLNVAVLPAGSFPTGAFQQLGSNSIRAEYVEYNPKRNYVMQWNLGVTRELSPNLAATVSYVGSRGVHMPYRMDNINMVLPTLTPAGYLYPSTATSQPLNPNYGRISANLWQANSFYDALQANLTKQMSRGITFHAAYTWGRSIDTLSATVTDNNYPNGIFNPLFFDQRTTRGLSDFNVNQNFVLNLTWQVPSARWRSRFTAWTFDGWQLGGVYKASTGQPFTPVLGGDPLGTKLDQTSEPPNRLVGPGCTSLVNSGNPNQYIKTQCLAFPAPANLLGNFGRNVLIGPGISNLDFSLIKNTPI
ncbi:MAG: hypothetical protein ACRD10_08185, partial [Terriglobia bacterium]